jgi:hypothetical protein
MSRRNLTRKVPKRSDFFKSTSNKPTSWLRHSKMKALGELRPVICVSLQLGFDSEMSWGSRRTSSQKTSIYISHSSFSVSLERMRWGLEWSTSSVRTTDLGSNAFVNSSVSKCERLSRQLESRGVLAAKQKELKQLGRGVDFKLCLCIDVWVAATQVLVAVGRYKSLTRRYTHYAHTSNRVNDLGFKALGVK